MTTVDQFAVVRFSQGWRILFDGRWRGRFDFEVDAVDAAIRLAKDVQRAGRSPRLLVQNRFGEMQLLELAQSDRDADEKADRIAS